MSNRRVFWLIAACSAAYCAGNVTGWIVPQIMFGIEQRYAVSATVASLVPTIEMSIIGILSILLGARSLNWAPRTTVIACLGVLAACNAVSTLLPGIPALVACRVLAALVTAVVLYYSTALVAATPHPDRSYAILNVINNAFGTLLLVGLPLVYPTASGLAYLVFSAILIAALLIPFAFRLPKAATPNSASVDAVVSSETSAGSGFDRPATIMLVLSITCIAISSFAHYSFAVPLGLRAGLSEADISITLGAGSMISTLGAVAAGFVAPRFGRLRPMLVALVVVLGANLLTVRAPNALAFRCGVVTNLTAMFFMLPVILGYSAVVDRLGRCGGIVMGAFVTACSVAPFIGGAISDQFGLNAFMAVSITSACIGVALTLTADRQIGRLTAATPT